MSGFEKASVRQLQSAIGEGSATRSEIVEAHLDRIAAVNPLINGFVEIRADEVLAQAAARDAQHGTTIAGPLDGVPVSVKDSYAVAGLRRTAGLPAWADAIDQEDDLTVQRLQDAGALILGHAAMPDLGIRWNTISGLYGTTRNPRDLARTAGGSSGGDAANVAAGLATVGIGGDLGGSIRVPAGFCGIYGLRPGAGSVPDVGPEGEGEGMSSEVMYEIGPLARTVDDIEVAFRVLAGFDARDPASVDAPLRAPIDGVSFAVMRHETGAVLDPQIEAALDETAEMLRAEGYEVSEGVLPDLTRAPELWAEILGTELIRDVLPPLRDMVIDSGRVHIEEMFGAFELGTDVTRYLAAWRERRRLQGLLLEATARHQLILAPIAGMAAPELAFDDHIGEAASIELFDRMRAVPWVNLFSLPALALPNGIQIVGRRFDELTVLRAGHAVERRLPPVSVATPVE